MTAKKVFKTENSGEDTLELVPIEKANDTKQSQHSQDEVLARLEPFETYIADLTGLAQVLHELNTLQDDELSRRITHYPPSNRLH